jgi:hypothetical protein
MMLTLLASLLGVGGLAGLALRFLGVAGVKKAAAKVPPKVWLFLAIAISLGLAVWWIDRRGYQRAQEQAEHQRLERAEITAAVVRAIDARLDRRLETISAKLAGQLQTIDVEGKTIVQPMLTRELLRDRSLSDPSRCLSPGLLNAVNAARGFLDSEQLVGGAAAGANPRSADPARVPAAGSRR